MLSPPLFFGNTEFAARFPIALVAWLGILIAGKWSKDLWGVTANRITVLMLSVTLGWFIFSHQILIDILLATLILASNYFFWKLLSKPQSWFYFFCLYTSIALCLLTKGLIGVFFISCSYIAIAINYRNWQVFKQTKLLLGILFTLVLILPWSLAIEKANPGFWHYFIVNEHLARVLDRRFPPDYVVSTINPWGYLGITAFWLFPWSLFLPSTISFVWQKFTSNQKKKKSSEYNAILLLTLGFILPIIVFLPLSSRLIYYSIPAILPYIILCSGALKDRIQMQPKSLFKHYKKLKINTNFGFYLSGLCLMLLGIISLTAIAFFPKLFQSFTNLHKYSIITSLVAAILIALTLGFVFSGIEFFRVNYSLSFKVLVISLFVTYSIVTVIFFFYQDVRSSKNLVAIVDRKLPINTLWIFEGSREIGAAGGITYYLNREKAIEQTKDSLSTNIELPLGFVAGKNTKIYRHVLVLEDGGTNRIPPKFPGNKPSYLINKQELHGYWHSMRPVVFVTDLLRNFNNSADPIELNLPHNVGQPLFSIGKRRVYINQAAIQSLRKNP